MEPFPDTPPLLSPAEHARMLHDIAQVSLAVAARADSSRAWDDLDVTVGADIVSPCPRERLGFLRHALPALAQASAQIAHSPLTDLHAGTRHIAPPARARRVSTPALLHAARAGHAGQWVDETISLPDGSTPEARLARSFIGRLRRDAEAIAALADASELADVAAEARACAMLATTLHALPVWAYAANHPLARPQAADDPLAWTHPPTERMQRHPAFGRIAALTRQYRRAFAFDWEHPLFALPARAQWQLYEMWGVFQTVRALLLLGAVPCPNALATPHGLLATRQTLLTLRLAVGEASRLDLHWPGGEPLSLFYNRPYPAGLHSLSRTLQPDICLEDAHGGTFLLDPKYKAYAAPGDEGGDMDQMHAYRDAIVAPDGTRPVRRAWCLYAGGLDTQARPVIAYGPTEASIVGALHLRPGDQPGFLRLCTLLRAWLGRPAAS